MKKIHLLFVLAFFICKNSKAQLIINEVLYDPSNVTLVGDANGDGVYSQTQDEFIEFFNTSTSNLNISGYEIWDDTLVGSLVYKFPIGTIIPARSALVVFGGGIPFGLFGNAIVLADTGTSGLSLNNTGEKITIKNNAGVSILTFDSDALSNNPDESYTRSPDITGNFVQHSTLGTRKFSPGTNINGAGFIYSLAHSITFKVDMNKYDLNFNKLNIAGNFNQWCNSCNTLQDTNHDGLWEITLAIASDTLEFKFVIDTIILENFMSVSACTRQNGTAINRYSIIKTDSILKSVCFEKCIQCANELSLKGITDFKIPFGTSAGKSIHLIADTNITNLSIYGIGVANNGGGTNGQELRFPAIAVAKGNQIIVVRDSASIASYFGECWSAFNTIIIDSAGIVSQNGDDAVELFKVGEVVETFGNANIDGTGKDWEYTGSWAFKNNTGNWIYGALNCTDSSTTIFNSKCVYPICTELKVRTITVNGENYVNSISQNQGTLQMLAAVLPVYSKDTTVTWSVTNSGVASINSNGLLTAIANGNAIVKATANDGSGIFGTKTINITGQTTGIMVSSVTVTSSGNVNTISTTNGTLLLYANVLPKNATDTTVIWDIDNKAIASINNNGLLTALANGIIKVKVMANDGSGKADSINITITNQIFKVTSLKIRTEGNVTTISEPNETLSFYADILPKNATDTSVTWSVNKNSIASISNKGLLTAIANGTVTVKATANDGSGKSDSLNINISNQTSLKELFKSKINIFPNPTNGMINIATTMNLNEYKIKSIYGNLLSVGVLESNQINIETLAAGVYFIEFKVNDSWANFKIIKTNIQ